MVSGFDITIAPRFKDDLTLRIEEDKDIDDDDGKDEACFDSDVNGEEDDKNVDDFNLKLVKELDVIGRFIAK